MTSPHTFGRMHMDATEDAFPQDELAAEPGPESLPCPNCDDPTPGNYCPNCGQRKTVRRASLRVMLADAIEDQFSLTTELPRTLKFLFTKPGFLTDEYSEGRIARYIEPLRLYLMASVLFFLAVSFRAPTVTAIAAAEGNAAALHSTEMQKAIAKSNARDKRIRATPDSLLKENELCYKHSTTRTTFCTQFHWLNEYMKPRLAHLSSIPSSDLAIRLLDFVIKRAPTVLFLMLPLFALLLKVLYVRSHRFYPEHFVFALHIHSFSFFVLGFIVLPLHWLAKLFGKKGQPVADFEFVALALLLWVVVYLAMAMKRFYRQRWLKTIPKFIVLSLIYSTILFTALAAEIVAAMIFI